MSSRSGFDVAYVAALGIGLFLLGAVVTFGISAAVNDVTSVTEQTQIVLVSALGTLGSIATGALGYAAGRRPPTRTDPPDTIFLRK